MFNHSVFFLAYSLKLSNPPHSPLYFHSSSIPVFCALWSFFLLPLICLFFSPSVFSSCLVSSPLYFSSFIHFLSSSLPSIVKHDYDFTKYDFKVSVQINWINYLQFQFKWSTPKSGSTLMLVGVAVAVLPKLFMWVRASVDIINIELHVIILSPVSHFFALYLSHITSFCYLSIY